MLRDISLIFLGYRVLLFAFFLALSIGKTAKQQALIVIPSALYLILTIYAFLYPGRLKLFRNYGDLIFLPSIALLSGQKEAMFALFAPIALYTSRKVFRGLLFFWVLVGFSFYYYGAWSFALLPAFLSLFIASLHPDLVEALKKERFYIRNLKRSYSELAKEYAKVEKFSQSSSRAMMLLDELTKNQSLHEYLTNLKERFELKSISIAPMQGNALKELVVDRTKGCLHVPVELERGAVNVSFYVSNPMQLHDKELIKTLEMAGKLINLYIEGFDEKPQAKVIAV